jgi:hypothetical protein
MSGTAHIVIDPSLRPAVEAVATILSEPRYLDVGIVLRIETDLLRDGYHGVCNAIVRDGRVVSFKRDEDV